MKGHNRQHGGISSSFKRMASGAAVSACVLAAGQAGAAEITLPPTSVTAALRSSFVSTNYDGPADDVNDFVLDSVRLQIGGKVTDTIGFSFNTDYNSVTSEVVVIDAIGQFTFSDQFNIWAGRFLPPSDRANLHGPYYGNAWGFAIDGIQDGYPFFAAGRDNGIAYWGDFDRVKVSAGVFDVPSTSAANGGDGKEVVYAARVHVSLWDIEKGYYLNGTYYGDKDILSFGAATHSIDGDTSFTIDGLMEKKLPSGGVVSIEGEWASYEGKSGGYMPGGVGGFDNSDGGFGLLAYLFPQKVGIGQIQLLGKYATNTYEFPASPDVDRDQIEFDVNYVIKAFNARLSLFYIDNSFSGAPIADYSQVGVGMQLQI
ncbi:porin [Hydrocarboniphaga sp.]|nr:porin [Hydrocarboniphaga sp.]MDZ4077810.1 hypothetical protein [Hydrocarboniphaga sp.]